jgi:HrpA-like RNA helicase
VTQSRLLLSLFYKFSQVFIQFITLRQTTQIPQFILEEAPADAKIVVAQPRRLAATGVAGRVADERGERNPGEDSVGYVVRGDNAMCNNTRLMFCTTGVLIRQLQSEGALDCITHVVVDEVHERHLDTDVLLGVLKESLATNPHLRVVLMSATMDADRFAAYWGNNTPRMHIPGFTHPVEDYTLADVLSITGYIPRKNGKKKKFYGNGNYMGKKKSSPWADSEKSDEEDNDDEEESIDPSIGSSTTASQGTNPQGHCIPIDELVKRVNESEIDYDLIGSLVRHLVQTRSRDDDGSILCFLPGAPEIAK